MENLSPPSDTAWVLAAPFRAHLRHLVEGSGLPWEVVALHAGVSVSTASGLLFGRRGRPLRRIARPVALRLLAVSVESVSRLPRLAIPAGASGSRARLLLGRGAHPQALARELGIPVGLLGALVDGQVHHVSRELALRLRALVELSDRDVASPGRQAA